MTGPGLGCESRLEQNLLEASPVTAVISLPIVGGPVPSDPLVDAKTLAEHFGLDIKTIRKLARSGHIPALAVRNGMRTYWRFHILEVENALRTQS